MSARPHAHKQIYMRFFTHTHMHTRTHAQMNVQNAYKLVWASTLKNNKCGPLTGVYHMFV